MHSKCKTLILLSIIIGTSLVKDPSLESSYSCKNNNKTTIVLLTIRFEKVVIFLILSVKMG